MNNWGSSREVEKPKTKTGKRKLLILKAEEHVGRLAVAAAAVKRLSSERVPLFQDLVVAELLLDQLCTHMRELMGRDMPEKKA